MDGACFVAAASACFLPTTSINSNLESLQCIRIVTWPIILTFSLSIWLKYFLTYLFTLYIRDATLIGPFFCIKNKKIDFKENKFNERFYEFSLLLHQNTQCWVSCLKQLSKLKRTLVNQSENWIKIVLRSKKIWRIFWTDRSSDKSDTCQEF